MFEAIIKVRVNDPADARARDISEGIGYACALLMDEYGWTATGIENLLSAVSDDMYETEYHRESTT